MAPLGRLWAVLAVVLAGLGGAARGYDFLHWEYSDAPAPGTDPHFQFGQGLAAAYKARVVARITTDAYLTKTLVPYFAAAGPGAAVYDAYLDRHNRTFPAYLRELEGIAAGCGLPFRTLFISQMYEEFAYFLPHPDHAAHGARPAGFPAREHCSDIMWATSGGDGGTGDAKLWLAHNEDGYAADVNHTALVSVSSRATGLPTLFSAYVYLGNQASNAFGWNEHGILFTLNYVAPDRAQAGGFGRVFIGRDLLEATTLEDALARVLRYEDGVGMATGHNYQLVDLRTGRILNVEVASFNRFSVREVLPGVAAFFHANLYRTFRMETQGASPSSEHREARAAELLRGSPLQEATVRSQMLRVLGDQEDTAYPLYHDDGSHARGDQSGTWTLLTLFVDLPTGRLDLFNANPRHNPPVFSVSVPELLAQAQAA